MTGARWRSYALVGPSIGLFTVLFVAPLIYFFLVSFWQFRSYRLVRDPTFGNYAEVLRSYLPLLLFTLEIAVAIALCSLCVGFLYAFVIRFKAGRYGPLLLFVAIVTLFGGYLMKVYAWRTILGTEGIINGLLLHLGLVDQPVTWLLYNPAAVIITLTHFLCPFSVLPLAAVMRSIADVELEAARDLGASSRRILVDHILPRCRSGIVAAFVLPFLIACGDWVTPVLVGGRMTMLGNLIAAQFGEFLNWPLGAAMSFTLLAAALLVIGAFVTLAGLVRPR